MASGGKCLFDFGRNEGIRSCGPGGPDDRDEIAADTGRFLDRSRITLDPWCDPAGMTRSIFATAYGFEAFPTTYLVGSIEERSDHFEVISTSSPLGEALLTLGFVTEDAMRGALAGSSFGTAPRQIARHSASGTRLLDHSNRVGS